MQTIWLRKVRHLDYVWRYYPECPVSRAFFKCWGKKCISTGKLKLLEKEDIVIEIVEEAQHDKQR